jgi:2,4-dichlorophenol 6-monooxygenase
VNSSLCAGTTLGWRTSPGGITTRFAQLIGSNGEEWINAAAEVTRKLGVEVSPVRIGPGGVLDPNGDWARVREIDESGCVLVRPDRHVAWRSLSLADNPRDSLLQAMRAILSR